MSFVLWATKKLQIYRFRLIPQYYLELGFGIVSVLIARLKREGKGKIRKQQTNSLAYFEAPKAPVFEEAFCEINFFVLL